MLLAALRDIEKKSHTNARKARTAASLIFDYAISTGRTNENPAKATLKALAPRPVEQRRKALSIDQVGPTLRTLEHSRIRPITRAALLMLLYTGLRDYSLRGAQWSEVDLQHATWTIPAARMKGRKGKKKPHTIPLPKQAVRVLRELHGTGTKPDGYIFPNQNRRGHMAEKTLCEALRVVSGVSDVTAHGCRSLITNALYEAGFRTEAIEVQMAHDIGTIAREHNEPVKSADPKVRAAYLRTGFLEQRATMMQWWADTLDALKANKPAPHVRNVVKLRA
jgi:integrase